MSNFPGQSAHVDGAYSMTRRFEGITKAGWTELDIRGPGWVQACPLLNDAEKADAAARAEIKRITFTVDAGTVDLADESSPGDRYTHADAAGNFSTAERKFLNAHGRSSVWWKAAAADFEIEVVFDIPRATDV